MTEPRQLRISDHALLRFIERVGGLDAEALRTALQASLNRAALAAGSIGAREFHIVADGLKYIVVEGKVITVLDGKMAVHRESHAKRFRGIKR